MLPVNYGYKRPDRHCASPAGKGADVDTKNKWVHTALMLAKKEGKKEIIRMLKEAGAKE